MTLTLRPYQHEAVTRIISELRSHRSTLLTLATGLGKTVTFAALAAKVAASGRRTLVLAHRRELLEQAASALHRFNLSTGIESADDRVDVAALPDVTLATVQTLRGERLKRFSPDAFALTVVDEAHHAVAKSYRSVFEHFASARILGVTATPDRADDVALGHVFESVAYTMGIREGIKGGWLAPVELRSVSVESLDLSRVRTVAGDLDRSALEAELVRDEVLHQVAKPLVELSQGRRTIAFVAGVEQAHALADVLRGYGIAAEAVDGGMERSERDAVRTRYTAGATQVVTNAMLYTEGFDAPETSCIALVRPTRSRSLLCQMIGRGTRLAEGKRECLVLDFVPERAPSIRLATPADALSGKELPDDVAAMVREASAGTAGDVLELVASAEAQAQAEAEQKRHALRCDVVYHTARLDPADLLEVANDMAPHARWAQEPATEKQIAVLRESGFQVEHITRGQADVLFGILKQRREAGLCTIKQARRLRSWSLRDDLPFDEARRVMDAIAENKWRPPQWVRAQYSAAV
jgi:superfamily II DNA or RNA helicase